MKLRVKFARTSSVLPIKFGEIHELGVPEDLEIYTGTHTVIPSTEDINLSTAQKFVEKDIKVTKVPFATAINISNGTTVTIGG